MKKHKILKNILFFFIIFSLLITSLGCNDIEDIFESDTISRTKEESYIPNHIKYEKVKDYQIIKNEKGYYLVFDDISVYKQEFGHGTLGFDID